LTRVVAWLGLELNGPRRRRRDALGSLVDQLVGSRAATRSGSLDHGAPFTVIERLSGIGGRRANTDLDSRHGVAVVR
jgi:hypothetical protein